MNKRLIISFFAMLVLLSANSKEFIDSVQFRDNPHVVINTEIGKDRAFVQLKKWIASSFDNYRCNVDMEDKESGIISLSWQTSKEDDDFTMLVFKTKAIIEIKDRKYKLSIVEGAVEVYSTLNGSQSSIMGFVKRSYERMKLFHKLSESNFSGAEARYFGEKYHLMLNQCKAELDATQKFKNDKDAKKGKTTKEWNNLNKKFEYVKATGDYYSETTNIILSSIAKALVQNDDF